MVIKRENKNKFKPRFDYKLLAIILVLLGFGLAVLYSASTVSSYQRSGVTTYFFAHQVIYGGLLGLVVMYIFSKIDYHVWQRLTPLIILATIVLLIAVLVPGLGYEAGFAKRWIQFGSISMQPAEMAKLALVFYIASWIDKRSHQIKDFVYGLIPSLLIVGIIAGLIIKEPDMGTMLVVTATALIMLFVGGSKIRHLFWILTTGIASFAVLVKIEPYRIARLTAFLNPDIDPKGIGYQINQALVSIGSSGWFGYGYGNSRQKYNFLPEVIGDSIFAVIVEELGFVRGSIAVILYLLFAFRGIQIAKAAPDTFGRMVAVGIVAWISIQTFVNIGAITGLLPLTGIPLPFVSYGSSALVVTLAAMGVLLNISKHSSI